MWGHWYPLFRTSDDSAAHGFQSQSGFIVGCTLLLLVCYDPKSHLWLLGLDIKPRSLICEASIISLRLPGPGFMSNIYFTPDAMAKTNVFPSDILEVLKKFETIFLN